MLLLLCLPPFPSSSPQILYKCVPFPLVVRYFTNSFTVLGVKFAWLYFTLSTTKHTEYSGIKPRAPGYEVGVQPP